MNRAVILAAGKGLRLRPFTETAPKALVPVAGKPLIQWTLDALPDSVKEVTIVVGYLGEQIQNLFGNNYQNKKIRYVTQSPLNGTASAVTCAKNFITEPTLVVNGDDLYSKEDLGKLSNNGTTILGKPSDKPIPGGLIVTEDNFLINIEPVQKGLQNCGAYVIEPDFFNTEMVGVDVRGQIEFSLPHTLSELAKTKKIRVDSATFWLPVGTPDELEYASEYLQKQ